MFPIIPGGKIPSRKGWKELATTDLNTISSWFHESPSINYGIRTGLENNIIVIDLDGPEARKWWTELGIGDSSAVVYSPRKDGGQHHYFRVYDMEVRSITGKDYVRQNPAWHTDVDIRGEGGLVVGIGSVTPDGAYHGNIDNIPDAPQELLDLLPEKQSYRQVTDEAEIARLEAMEKATEPTETELQDIAHIKAWLLSLPRKWSAGDGWHDTVFRSCAWLWRMVRTPSYALTEAEALDIMLNCTPVWPDEGWAEDEILKQWDSARELTRGQFADTPAEQLPQPLDFVECVNELPAFAPRSGQEFLLILNDERAKVKNLIEECLLAGLTPHQAVSVVHGSKAGEALRTDYGYRKLWREASQFADQIASKVTSPNGVIKLDSEIGAELQPSAKIARPAEVDTTVIPRAVLMSDAEREVARQVEWFGTEYTDWTREVTPVWNGPYHRMNRWTILSLVYSPYAVIPEATGDMYLNFFSFILGETTTGKSESRKLMFSVIRQFFTDENDPDIGGDPSPSALAAALIERDEKASLLNADEAHGKIARMKLEKSYQVGLMEELAFLYDGEVSKMLRSTNKEVSNKRARTYFSIHYMGTFEGITDVLEPEDWNSGFLHRFIWAIGEKSSVTRDSLRPKFRKPGEGKKSDPHAMQKQWAAQFRANTMRIAPNGEPVELEMTDAFAERFTTLRERMYAIADERPELKERLYPASRRMSNSIMKAAALVAVSQGRTVVDVEDLLVAMLDGEEWFGNVLYMVTATDTSKFVRQVAAIERIVDQAGGELRMEDVYRQSGVTKHATDNLVGQLVAEGRAEKVVLASGKHVLKTIGEV